MTSKLLIYNSHNGILLNVLSPWSLISSWLWVDSGCHQSDTILCRGLCFISFISSTYEAANYLFTCGWLQVELSTWASKHTPGSVWPKQMFNIDPYTHVSFVTLASWAWGVQSRLLLSWKCDQHASSNPHSIYLFCLLLPTVLPGCTDRGKNMRTTRYILIQNKSAAVTGRFFSFTCRLNIWVFPQSGCVNGTECRPNVRACMCVFVCLSDLPSLPCLFLDHTDCRELDLM